MMTRMVNGKSVTLTSKQEADLIAEAATRAPVIAKQILDEARLNKIQELKDQKLNELLAPQITAVNNAVDLKALEKIK